MNSKRQKCTMRIKALHRFLIAALLAGLLASTINVAYASGPNNALDFDGTDLDYVRSDTSFSIIADATRTIEAWVKIDAKAEAIFASIGNTRMGIGMNSSGEFISRSYNAGGQIHNSGYGLETGIWYHLTAVFSGGNSTLYVNGLEVSSSSPCSNAGSNDQYYYVGVGHVTLTEVYFDGQIDEVRIWSESRTTAEIRANMYKELAGSEANLEIYYKLDETSGTTADNAEGTLDHDGTLTGTGFSFDNNSVTSSAFAGPRYALDFDGVDDYVDCGENSDFQHTGDLTLEAWASYDALSSGSNHLIFLGDDLIDGDGSQNTLYMLTLDSTKKLKTFLEYGEGNNVSIESTEAADISSGEWHHYAMTRDTTAKKAKFYVDGVQLGDEVSYSNNPTGGSSSNLLIGAALDHSEGTPPPINEFDGKIDEVRIWWDVRTAAEIRENMLRSLVGNESDLTAYYNFNHTSGTTLADYDVGGTVGDGTLTNMDDSDWVSSQAFNTWLDTNSTSWSTGSNWSRGSAPDSTDNIGIYGYTGGSNPTIGSSSNAKHVVVATGGTLSIASDATLTCGGDVIINGTLSIASGGTLDLDSNKIIASTGTFTNNGTLSDNETKSVTSGSPQTFLDGQSNNAAYMTSGDSDKPGNTTVTASIGSTIPANAFGTTCSAAANSVKRYYNVTADTSSGLDVTLRLYYDDGELNGNTEGSLEIYHCESGSWVKEDGAYSRDGSNNYVEVTGVDSFSPFILGDSGPTAVTLARFTASPEGNGNGFVLALVALGAVWGALLLRARRRR